MLVVDGTRQVPTGLRYPATAAGSGAPALRDAGQFPLIVFSAGFDIAPESYAALLDQWASEGYVVADPNYPATAPGAPGGVNEMDIVQHPADLRAVITALLQAGNTPGGVLSGIIDPRDIGAAGHSDGGDVTDAVATNTCCRDGRVTAAAILSGAELTSWGGTYEAAGAPPLLVAQGSADPINVPGCSQQIYNTAGSPKYYLDLIGAGHHSPYLASGPYQAAPEQAAAYQAVVTRATIDFWNAYLKHSSTAAAALLVDAARSGVSTITSGPTVPVTGGCPGAPVG